MKEDFVTRLQLQLRDAAAREATRSTAGRIGDFIRGILPKPQAAAALAAVLAALVVAGVLVARGGEERAIPSRPPSLQVVAQLRIGEAPRHLAAAFGDVWVVDQAAPEVLRVDPASRRVTGRVPVGAQTVLTPGRRALHATTVPGTVLRIDPEQARVTARREVGGTGGTLVDDDQVWAIGGYGATRLDARTLEPGARVVLPGRSLADGWGLADGHLWAIQRDGRVNHYDAVTGARRDAAGAAAGLVFLWSDHGMLFAADRDRHLLRLDPRSGAELWRAPLERDSTASTVSEGVLWLHLTGRAGEEDRLAGFDLGSGRRVPGTTLPEFGVEGLTPVADQLWMTTAGNDVLVLGHS